MKVTLPSPSRSLIALSMALLIVISLGTLGPLGPLVPQEVIIVAPVSVIGMPAAEDMVVVKEGFPYTVPQDKRFVLTGLGSDIQTNGHVHLLVDNVIEVSSDRLLNSSTNGEWDTVSVSSAPVGFTARGGRVLTLQVTGSPQFPTLGRAWGYLEDRE